MAGEEEQVVAAAWCDAGDEAGAEAWLAESPGDTRQARALLLCAAQRGRPGLVHLALAAGVMVNTAGERGDTALHLAARDGRIASQL